MRRRALSQTPREYAVEVRNLTKRYPDGTQAVTGVSFAVGTGETFGLLGSSGAGKSTVIAMLSTRILPTAGTARLAGFDVAREPDRVRGLVGVQMPDAWGAVRVSPLVGRASRTFGLSFSDSSTMSPRPDHSGRRPSAAGETSATSPAASFAHVGGATVSVVSYLALIPGFLPVFVLAAALGLVLLVPMLAIAAASWLLLLPVVALRRLARQPTSDPDHTER
jgi:hypothetical protein